MVIDLSFIYVDMSVQTVCAIVMGIATCYALKQLSYCILCKKSK